MEIKHEKSFVRVVNIHLENKAIGDGYFVPEVIKTLKQYIKMLEGGGSDSVDIFISEGGTRVTVLGEAWQGHDIPQKLENPRLEMR